MGRRSRKQSRSLLASVERALGPGHHPCPGCRVPLSWHEVACQWCGPRMRDEQAVIVERMREVALVERMREVARAQRVDTLVERVREHEFDVTVVAHDDGTYTASWVGLDGQLRSVSGKGDGKGLTQESLRRLDVAGLSGAS